MKLLHFRFDDDWSVQQNYFPSLIRKKPNQVYAYVHCVLQNQLFSNTKTQAVIEIIQQPRWVWFSKPCWIGHAPAVILMKFLHAMTKLGRKAKCKCRYWWHVFANFGSWRQLHLLFASMMCCKKSSSHPKGVFKGLVRGEAIRFFRSNSSQDNYQRTISTFRHHLLCKGYPKILLTHSSLQFHSYPLRSNYIQPLPTRNLSSSLTSPSSTLTFYRTKALLCAFVLWKTEILHKHSWS